MIRAEIGEFREVEGLAPDDSVGEEMFGLMRLILALSALAVVTIDPAQLDRRFLPLTFGVIVVYTLFSVGLYFLPARQVSKLPAKLIPWIDVGCYCLLIALSGGTNSIFFFLLFFGILEGSFRWGTKTGMRITTFSVVLFTVISLAATSSGADFQLNRFLLRTVYLLVLGYIVAYLGGAEIQLKQQLRLLRDVSRLSNPRFGIGHTLFSFMKRVRQHYDADACVLLLCDQRINKYRMSRVGREDSEREMRAERVPKELAQQFLTLPETLAVVYNAGRRMWQPRSQRYFAIDRFNDVPTDEGLEQCKALAVKLEAESFLSIPLFYKGKGAGRLFLTGDAGKFEPSDIEFLLQIIEQVTRVLKNIQLLDQLASGAAEQERQKIARDLHDTVIQPYIGLQYKVAAIHNKLNAGQDVTGDLKNLLSMTVNEVAELRDYVRELKDAKDEREGFLAAVNRYTGQFQENYGIAVEVDCKPDVRVNDRLTAELIQMVHEGLSNVRKHTESATSRISFQRSDNHIIMSIENDGPAGSGAKTEPFVPKSVSERAEALGGRAQVEQSDDGRTVVRVSIPL